MKLFELFQDEYAPDYNLRMHLEQERGSTEAYVLNSEKKAIWTHLEEILNAGLADDAPLPQNFCEMLKIIDPASSESIQFQNYMEALTHKMLPSWDFNNNPIRFVIADDKEINAGVITTGTPAIMIFNVGLLTFVKDNENMLLHVLGHELGHKLLRENTGEIEISKPEETLVNIPNLQWMYENGINPEPALEFALKLQSRSKRYTDDDLQNESIAKIMEVAIAVMDEHLSPGFEADTLNNTLIAYAQQVAGDFSDKALLRIPEEMQFLFRNVKHFSHVKKQEKFAEIPFSKLNNKEKLEFILKETRDAPNGYQEQRSADIARLLNSIKPLPDEDAKAFALNMADAITGHPVLSKTLYRTLNSKFMQQKDNTAIYPLTNLNLNMLRLLQANNIEDFLTSSEKVISEARRLSPYPLQYISIPRTFRFPSDNDFRRASKNNSPLRLPWERHLRWAIKIAKEEKNENGLIALYMLGVEDPRLFMFMRNKTLLRVFNGNLTPKSGAFSLYGVRRAKNGIEKISSLSANLDGFYYKIEGNSFEFSPDKKKGYKRWNQAGFVSTLIDIRKQQILLKDIKITEISYKYLGEIPFHSTEGFDKWFEQHREGLLPPQFLTEKNDQIRLHHLQLVRFFNESPEQQQSYINTVQKFWGNGRLYSTAKYDSFFAKIMLQDILPFDEQAKEVIAMFQAQLSNNGDNGRELVRSFFLNPPEKPGFRNLMEGKNNAALLLPYSPYVNFIRLNHHVFTLEERASILSQHVPLLDNIKWWGELLEVDQISDANAVSKFFNNAERYAENLRFLGNKAPTLTHETTFGKTEEISKERLLQFLTNISHYHFQIVFGYNYAGTLDVRSILQEKNSILQRLSQQGKAKIDRLSDNEIAELVKPALNEKTLEKYIKWVGENSSDRLLRQRAETYEEYGFDDEEIDEIEALESFDDGTTDYSELDKALARIDVFQNFLEDYFFKDYSKIKQAVPPPVPASDIETMREILRKHVAVQQEWPEGIIELAKIYRNLDNLDLMPNYLWQASLRDKILSAVKEESDLILKLSILKILLGGQPLKDAYVRQESSQLFVNTLHELQKSKNLGINGLDDGGEPYFLSITPYIDWCEENIPATERYRIFILLADILESQRDLSYRLRDSFLLDGKNLEESDNFFRVGEALLLYAIQDSGRRAALLDNLMQDDTPDSHKKFGTWIRKERANSYKEISRATSLTESENEEHTRIASFQTEIPMTSDKDYYEMLAQNIHNNFWKSPLPARIAILDQLLLSADEKNYSRDNAATKVSKSSKKAYDRAFQYVVDKLLPENIEYSKESRLGLENYKDSLLPGERALFLAAILAANDAANQATHKFSTGERLATVLDMMGPAEVKFGQGISNYPDAPMDIRQPMIRLTKHADPSPRWALWQRHDDIVPEEFQIGRDNSRMGKSMASASYNETVRREYKDGSHSVLVMQRPYVERRAQAGFSKLRKFVKSLYEAGAGFEKNVADSADMILKQAQDMAQKETNVLYRLQQVEQAQGYYNGVSIFVDGHKFTFETARWLAYGVDREEIENRIDRKEWCEQEEMPGVHFDEIPDVPYKKAMSIAILTMELAILLSGQPIDHDRHTAQGKIDVSTSHIGLFDHGALDLDPPSTAEIKLLAEIMVELTKQYEKGTSVTKIFHEVLEKLPQTKKDNTNYLIKVERALLALNPFFEQIEPDDFKHIITAVYNFGHIDQNILDIKISAPLVGSIKLSTAFSMTLPKIGKVHMLQDNLAPPKPPIRFDYKMSSFASHPAFPGMKKTERTPHEVESEPKQRAIVSFEKGEPTINYQ